MHSQHLKTDIAQFVKSAAAEMVDKWSMKPSLAEKLVDILSYMADKDEVSTEIVVQQFGFTATSAKRYLRQLTAFGYLEAKGGNKNRTYTMLV